MNFSMKEINTGQIKDLQRKQHFNAIIIQGTVPKLANGGALTAKFNLASYGDFLCNDITGSYSSLVEDQAAAVDDGVCHLSAKLSDGQGGIQLFDDFIPLNLFLTPGRQRTMGVLVDAAGGVPNVSLPMFFPKYLVHLFPANNDIVLELRNDADWENTFKIAFWGTRIKQGLTTQGMD